MIKASIMKMGNTKANAHDVLIVNGRPLMWDTPKEQLGQKSLADQAYGDVLCAGYGLGILQGWLLKNPKVKSIFTVEKYPAVIDVCREHYRGLNGLIWLDDIYEYFTYTIRKDSNVEMRKFDCIIGDIWTGSVAAYVGQYKKFRKAAKRHLKPGGIIILGDRDV